MVLIDIFHIIDSIFTSLKCCCKRFSFAFNWYLEISGFTIDLKISNLSYEIFQILHDILTGLNTIAQDAVACDIAREERDPETDRSHLPCFPTLRICTNKTYSTNYDIEKIFILTKIIVYYKPHLTTKCLRYWCTASFVLRFANSSTTGNATSRKSPPIS